MARRNLILIGSGILALGLVFLVINWQLPIVRNSFAYAKAALNIAELGFNPLPVVADVGLSNGKPIGFSLLAVPPVLMFGANGGVKVASFAGTAFFLVVACFFFARANRLLGLSAGFLPVELTFLFFNPLAFYQFWSGYADTLFAGLVLLAFILVDRIAVAKDGDSKMDTLLLGVVISLAVLTKLYGLILGIACPVYFLLRSEPTTLRREALVSAKMAWLAGTFVVLGLGVLAATAGYNTLLNLTAGDADGGGYGSYIAGLFNPSAAYLAPLVLLGLTLVLSLHFALLFLMTRSGRGAWPLAPTVFAAIFLVGLIPFPGASYNMRFFLPIFPFVCVAIAAGMSTASVRFRRPVLAAYLSAATLLTLNYNVQGVYGRLLSVNESFEELLDGRPLDNLRMGQHMSLATRINFINQAVERDGKLYWISKYYGAATHGMGREIGLRGDINISYAATPARIRPKEDSVYLTPYRTRTRFSRLRDDFNIESLGSALFRLDPIGPRLTGPLRDHVPVDEAVVVTAEIIRPLDTRAQVELLVDGAVIGVDRAPPVEFVWTPRSRGRHVCGVRIRRANGETGALASRVVFAGIPALERYITRSGDAAEELPNGRMYLTSSDLELTEDPRRGNQVVGLRFSNIAVPPRATVAAAYLQFTVDEVSREPTRLTIRAQLSGNAAAFGTAPRDLSSRMTGSMSVDWSPEPWELAGESSLKQRTPDLSALVQEVVDHPDWRVGAAMVFRISGRGRRVATAFGAPNRGATRLYVELSEP